MEAELMSHCQRLPSHLWTVEYVMEGISLTFRDTLQLTPLNKDTTAFTWSGTFTLVVFENYLGWKWTTTSSSPLVIPASTCRRLAVMTRLGVDAGPDHTLPHVLEAGERGMLELYKWQQRINPNSPAFGLTPMTVTAQCVNTVIVDDIEIGTEGHFVIQNGKIKEDKESINVILQGIALHSFPLQVLRDYNISVD